MNKIKIACIGAGYFARFHVEAWSRISEVELVAVCDLNKEKAASLAREFQVRSIYSDIDELLASQDFEVLDIITPPESHLSLCAKAVAAGKHVICQKPLAPSFAEAESIIELVEQHDIRFMVHENFRFQPWYREIKRLMEEGVIGDKLHSLTIKMRTGDGWGPNAYMDRQPYFQKMKRLFVHETGVHYIDVMRFLAGDIQSVYARLRKLNPVIAGEDCALILADFCHGGMGVIDGNRYNDSTCPDPRYTFGETTVEGNDGTIRLYSDGNITIQKLGEREKEHPYEHSNKNFAGDCVFATQKHFIDSILNQQSFESNARDYLKNLSIQEAIYLSSAKDQRVYIEYENKN